MDTCTHTVMPASIEMINYYFHQISSFCCFKVLCCINHWWHLPIAGDPVMARPPLADSELQKQGKQIFNDLFRHFPEKFSISQKHFRLSPKFSDDLFLVIDLLILQMLRFSAGGPKTLNFAKFTLLLVCPKIK